jgi:hypothetical protein
VGGAQALEDVDPAAHGHVNVRDHEVEILRVEAAFVVRGDRDQHPTAVVDLDHFAAERAQGFREDRAAALVVLCEEHTFSGVRALLWHGVETPRAERARSMPLQTTRFAPA